MSSGSLAERCNLGEKRVVDATCERCSRRFKATQEGQEQFGQVLWIPVTRYCGTCKKMVDAEEVAAREAEGRRLAEERTAERDKELRKVLPQRYASVDPASLVGALREWDGERSFYITGPVGTGKTHQAAAFLRYHAEFLMPTDPWGRVSGMATKVTTFHWLNVPNALEAIRRSFNKHEDDFDLKPDVGLLVMDDLGVEKPSEWVREQLYNLVNHRYERELPLLVTSNMSINQVAESIGERTASRLHEMCGKPVGLGGKDRRKSS